MKLSLSAGKTVAQMQCERGNEVACTGNHDNSGAGWQVGCVTHGESSKAENGA